MLGKSIIELEEYLQKISVCSGIFSVILSASGLGTSLTGFGAVVGIPLGVFGGFLWGNIGWIRCGF